MRKKKPPWLIMDLLSKFIFRFCKKNLLLGPLYNYYYNYINHKIFFIKCIFESFFIFLVNY